LFSAVWRRRDHVVPVDGRWEMPSKKNADVWNAMPKPDKDVEVYARQREEEKDVEFKFVWGEAEETEE
jgi:hypothetical protein